MKKLVMFVFVFCMMIPYSLPMKASSTAFTIQDVEINEDGYYMVDEEGVSLSSEDNYNMFVDFEGNFVDITLNNLISEGSLWFSSNYADEQIVTIDIIGQCELDFIGSAHDLTITGNGELKVGTLNGKGLDSDHIKIDQGVSVYAGFVSCGASGAVNGIVEVAGTLSANEMYIGCMEVLNGGRLYVNGPLGLAGKHDGNYPDFRNALVVEDGGYIKVDAVDVGIHMYIHYVDESLYGPLSAQDYFNLGENMLPENVCLHLNAGQQPTIMFAYNDNLSDNLELEQSANQFVIAKRYEIICEDVESSHTLALPNEVVTLTAFEAPVLKVFDRFEMDADVEVKADGTFVMPYQDVHVKAIYKDLIIEQLSLNKEQLQFDEKDQSETLIASYIPETLTNVELVWSSSDEQVVRVDQNGKVVAVSDGEATICVKDTISKLEASCEVEVAINYDITTIDCSVDMQKAKANAIVTITPDELNGYRFIGYTTNVEGLVIENNRFTMPNQDVEIKANYEKILVETLELNKKELHLKDKGEQEQLTATIKPENALNKKMIYKSSDENIAIVDESGVVSAINEGECEIIVVSEDGNAQASCKVIVKFETTSDNDLNVEEDQKDEPAEEEKQEETNTNDKQEEKQEETNTNDKQEEKQEDKQEDKQEQKPEEKPSSPQTSDSSNMMMYLCLLISSMWVLIYSNKKMKA